MADVLAVVGPIVVAVTWLVVRSGRASIWIATSVVMAVLGVLSLLTGNVEATRDGSVALAAAVGVGAGVALYLATAAFMAVAGGWPPLARHATALYGNRGSISVPLAVALSALVVAPGEELLWRGVVLDAIGGAVDGVMVAAALAWLGYVAANAFSGSIPILLGAVVGGAAWTALAVTRYGITAAIGCHAVWTSLMILRPPVRRPA
ncbi:MAG: CPBP family glutamic-type intramembrane protease [Actinomycetota bacterium]